MQYRTLGRTGLKVSEIGFGGWGIGGGNEWRDSNDEESRAALRRAFELGVNFYDTALVYNDGHSEKLVGELARSVGRDKLLIASKIPPKNMEWPARYGVKARETFPSDHIRKCTEQTLKNLGTNHVDLMQLHVWQDPWLEENDWIDELDRLKRSGKIRFVGVSINDHDPESAMLLAQSNVADVVQVIFNIFDQNPVDTLFPLTREANLGVIARVPLDMGGLSGTMTASTRFPQGDFREGYFRGNRKKELEEKLEGLHRLVGKEASSLPDLALRFVLSSPDVSTVIPGMRKVAHVEANVAASDGRHLSPSLLTDLRQSAWRRNFYESDDDIRSGMW